MEIKLKLKPSGLVLLLSDARGVYIPRDFAQGFDFEKWGVSEEDATILAQGPDHEWYWETWENVLNTADFELEGWTYRLHQDGNLWAYCDDLMSDEEYENFWGEARENAPL